MEDTRLMQRLCGLCCALLAALTMTSCPSTVYAPDRGVTQQFYPREDWQSVDLTHYDFSRLSQDVGLCVFSYEFRGEGGSKIFGFQEEVERGVRVWEYRFSPDDWDVKEIREKIMIWGFRPLTLLFLKRAGIFCHAQVTFHRGRIVYGGRLKVDMSDPPEAPFGATVAFDEDMGSWLTARSDALAKIKIDTALIFVY